MFLFLQYLFWFYVQVSEILNISIIKIFQNIDGRYYHARYVSICRIVDMIVEYTFTSICNSIHRNHYASFCRRNSWRLDVFVASSMRLEVYFSIFIWYFFLFFILLFHSLNYSWSLHLIFLKNNSFNFIYLFI